MTLVFDGAGGVFTRIGAFARFVSEVREVAAQSGTAGRWPYEINDLYVKFEGGSNDLQAALDAMPQTLASAQSAAAEIISACRDAARSTLITMVNEDDPLPELSVVEAMRVLIAQMVANTEDVAANAVSATVTAGASNSGDGVFVASVRDPLGYPLENLYAEDVICQRDATAQFFTCRGEVAADSKLAPNWPLGSGAEQQVNSLDATGGTNMLAGGGFDDYAVANTPDEWSIVAGSAGTQILEETTNKLAGDGSVEFVGNATGASIRQDVTDQVASRTPYALNLFYKLSGDPAAGVLELDLYDGSSTINDDAGNANTITVSLPGVNDTNWHSLGAIFTLPDPLPAAVYVRIRLSTALSVGTSVFIDLAGMVAATRLYVGGPYVACFQGGTEFAIDDTFNLAFGNNRASLYQEAVNVFFDTMDTDQRLPTDPSPSITNSFPSYEGV
jgi:hypothetical protein